MKLAGIQIFEAVLDCHKPFRIATGSSHHCRTLVVCLTTDTGLTGWGEAVPKPHLTGDTFAGSLSALKDYIWPGIKGKSCWNLIDIHRIMDSLLHGYPVCKAAIDVALYDLLSKECKQPLLGFLGGNIDINPKVATNLSIGLASPSEVALEGRKIVESGFKAIKLKVGLDPKEDIERVHALRASAGPEIKIRIDANEGWNYSQALIALKGMEPFDVELAEQPLNRQDLEGLRRLRNCITIPVFADESLQNSTDAVNLAKAQACDGFNIKLMKCGGIKPALDIIAVAKAQGLSLMIGGMVGESEISLSAATALAGAYNFDYADLDADLLLKDKLCPKATLTAKDSFRYFTQFTPGLGVNKVDDQYLTEVFKDL